jgi:hypothetical protein
MCLYGEQEVEQLGDYFGYGYADIFILGEW